MKTNILLLSVVLLYIFPHCFCQVGTPTQLCIDLGGVVPISILNSPYTILPNGSLCCPLFVGNTCNTNDTVIAPLCPGGLVFEPCFFCKTCGKLAGESCGGIQYQDGRCDEGLECVITDVNSTIGTCYREATRSIGERCGGLFAIEGRCLPGLRCSVSEQRFLDGNSSPGVCLNETTAPPACFKDCSTRANQPAFCGTDGRLYDNRCFVRQQNCIIPEGRQPQIIKARRNNRTCANGCGDVEVTARTKLSLHAKVDSYSFEVVDGSIATIVCEEGFKLVNPECRESGFLHVNPTESISLKCSDQSWKLVAEINGNEVLIEDWKAICYESSDASMQDKIDQKY